MKEKGLKGKTPFACAVFALCAAICGGGYATAFAAADGEQAIVSDKYAVADYCGESNFSVFMDKDGYLYASGDNSVGQLGRKKLGGKASIEPLEGKILSEKAAAFDTGRSGFTLAVTQNGKLYGWGNNANGQLCKEIKTLSGPDDKSNCYPTPLEITLPSDCVAADVQAGYGYALLLSADGGVYAWGQNNCGQLGLSLEASRKVNVTEPTKIPAEKFGGEKIVQIAAAEYTSFAVTESGKLYAWGDTEYGQLCDGETDADSEPVTEPKQTLLTGVKKVSAESTTAMALTVSGEAYAWGNNLFGQLGCGRLNVTENNKWSNSPVKIENFYSAAGKAENVEIVDIACGGIANFLLSKNGGVYACGSGGAGELGFLAAGSTFEEEGKVLAPTKVTFYEPISIENLAASGQTTDGTPVDKTVVKSVKIVEFINTIGERTFVKDEDGNVWSWGKNTDGQVASGNVSITNVPVRSTLFRDKDYDVNIKEKNYLIEPLVGLSIIFGGAALFFIATEIKWARQRRLEKSGK